MLQNLIKTRKTLKNRKDTRWGVFFCACDIGIHVFSCSFCVEFGRVLYILCMFFDTFPEQSNTGNRKNECILSHLDTSRVGVSFLRLRYRNACFFVLILRRIWTRFVFILRDFGHPSGNQAKVYEWPVKQSKIRNFHHFFTHF